MPGKKPTHTGRDATKEATGIKHEISIHAPHTGRDFPAAHASATNRAISIHAPHTGRDEDGWALLTPDMVFQSTRPIRGATIDKIAKYYTKNISIHAPHTGRDYQQKGWMVGKNHFNPRAPYGARLEVFRVKSSRAWISIHAPHTGRDTPLRLVTRSSSAFQSTRPIRGATSPSCGSAGWTCISIHAPHTGRDESRDDQEFDEIISIHAPHTGRDLKECRFTAPLFTISIHAPHTGRDNDSPEQAEELRQFQSTRPIRGATSQQKDRLCGNGDFNPRAPYGARHSMLFVPDFPFDISIHAPHTGRDVMVEQILPT